MLFKALHGNMTCGISHTVLSKGGITITRIIEGILYSAWRNFSTITVAILVGEVSPRSWMSHLSNS